MPITEENLDPFTSDPALFLTVVNIWKHISSSVLAPATAGARILDENLVRHSSPFRISPHQLTSGIRGKYHGPPIVLPEFSLPIGTIGHFVRYSSAVCLESKLPFCQPCVRLLASVHIESSEFNL